MAQKVRFVKDYDVQLSPRDGHVAAYKKGQEDTLTDKQAEEALAAGAVEEISDRTPSKRKE